MLKGIFKRGKNKKQDNSAERTSTTPQPANNTAASKPPASAATANGTAPAIEKPLPPTHPLSTGQHDTPQEAVPQNHEAQVGPDPASQQAQKEANNQETSATTATADSSAAPVSGIGSDGPPVPPPKTDAQADAARPADTAGRVERSVLAKLLLTAREVKGDAPPTVPSSTTTPAAPPVQPITQPTDTLSAAPPSTTDQASNKANGTASSADLPTPAVTDEKVPVLEQPVSSSKPAAPGMTATSGPLEDYPEGGHVLKD